MRVLDLFSGIGGFSLGLERAGMTTVAFCEIEEYPRRVLAKHWPHVPIHRDVRELKGADVGAVDVICGGFPCQDISVAGKGAGLAGERSGLWVEYARLVGELRPRYVIVENVAALLGRGIGTVLGDLAALGYDAEWHCISAASVGAPHLRERIWIVAYPGRDDDAGGLDPRASGREAGRGEGRDLGKGQAPYRQRLRIELGASRPFLADADDARRIEQRPAITDEKEHQAAECGGWWSVEPDVGRVAHGVPARVDRLRGLGNAVVPQIPEIIGRAILAAEANA
jgi:DNA (cytosine-5)-methyltransferase 1